MAKKLSRISKIIFNKYKEISSNFLRQENLVNSTVNKRKMIRLSHILIIDDDQSCVTTLELLLKSQKYNVFKAADGKKGLSWLSDHSELVDLVFLDLMMPELDGFEVLKQMSETEILRNIPVIIQSGIVDNMVMSKIPNQSVKGYITKPYRKKELLSVIDNIYNYNTLPEADFGS